jgi:hypothetical protein
LLLLFERLLHITKEEKMDKLTRRSFFMQASAGIATTGMLVASPALVTATDTPVAHAVEVELSSTADLPTTSLVAHIRDASTGEIGILFGTQEITYRDRELVARLLQAVR